ncbi:amino acid ABC transporter permease [Paraburkholderia fungorum]|uniref:amino acid ABC transporter permease n=1 Tax=Paraburkholderia fungorum TaxID=134537 RepID=UPI0038BDF23A
MTYQFDFSVILASWQMLLDGCLLTLRMTGISIVIGLAIALVTIACRRSAIAPFRWLARGFIEIIRNTPFLVQVFFIFFGLPSIGIGLTAGTGAVIALSLNGGAYFAEVIRGGVDAVDRGQIEAARALGLTPLQTFRDVVLRPAMRTAYPALCSQCVLLLLTSSIVSSISANELTAIAQRLESITFRSFEVYISVTLLYLTMSVLLSALLKGIGRVYFSYPTR